MNRKISSQEFMKHWKNVRAEIQSYLNNTQVKELQKTVSQMVKKAQTDLNKIVDVDVPQVVKTFKSEKKIIEQLIQKAVQVETRKVKNFIKDHQGEISKIQKKLESYVGKKKSAAPTRKKTTKKATAKKATRKKATRS